MSYKLVRTCPADTLAAKCCPASTGILLTCVLPQVDEIRGVGVNHFHFSLNWSALVPTGDVTRPNATLLGYYRCFTRQLLQANVTPIVTLWHHTRQRSSLPGSLDDANKWLNG